MLEFASEAAADAGIEADDPEKIPGDVALKAAIEAADSISHAALAAEYAATLAGGREPFGSVAECVGWVARGAAYAAANPDSEREWQTARLADYLIGNPGMLE